MIEFDNVCKAYKTGDTEYRALRGLSFSIAANEMVAIMGPSGSGKTTTMNIIGLLDRPTTGIYRLLGKDVSELNSNQLAEYRNQFVGFIFQSFLLLPRLTALQNVGLPLMYRRVPKAEIKRCAMDMLERVGIAEFYRHRPFELSGGQQQRVAIARALVGQPKLILADEPTGALDSKTGEVVMQLLKDLYRSDSNTTVVIITHDAQVAGECSRVIKVHDGEQVV